jgi:hypothetical protein
LKIKLKGGSFDTTQMIDAESQAALNNFIEHYFQDVFKNCRSAGNGAYAQKATTFKVIMASRPDVSS